jgi:thymidine kinase
VANELADRGKRVIVAGLDMDYNGVPFGPMPQLMAVAEFVTKVHAICVRSGTLAHYSHRLTADPNQVMLGDRRTYEPLSRAEFVRERNRQS